MYNIFGSKWLMLHEGPMLSTISIGQQHTLAACRVTDPLKVHCIVYKHLGINITIHMHNCPKASTNIPGVSSRTIRRLNNDSGFTKDATIQVYQLITNCIKHVQIKFLLFQLKVEALVHAAHKSSDARWWLKADSCDLTAGLFESVRGKWSGDVDINDGKVAELYQLYQSHQKFCESLGLKEPQTIPHVKAQVQEMRDTILSDLEYISTGEF